MDLRERIERVIEELRPKLNELADGYVELVDADPATGEVTLKLIGGRLC